jgi:hypothetical protein
MIYVGGSYIQPLQTIRDCSFRYGVSHEKGAAQHWLRDTHARSFTDKVCCYLNSELPDWDAGIFFRPDFGIII